MASENNKAPRAGRRKWSQTGAKTLLAAVLLALAGGASAQLAPRLFPADVHYGLFKGSAWPIQPAMLIGDTPRRVAVGFVARGPLNQKLSGMPSGSYAVAWAPDTQGQILRVWILTPAENQALAAKFGRGGNTE